MKRVLTTIIGLPIIICLLTFTNKYVVDVIISILLIIAMHEFFGCVKHGAKPISWIGYALALFIAFMHIIPISIIKSVAIIAIPTVLTILFLYIIISNMKYTFDDIAITFTGILYLFSFTIFIPLLYGNSSTIQSDNGKVLIWYIFLASWGSDIFAYLIGRKGTHKFSKVSPNKTIEGCVAGVVAAVVFSIIYTIIIQKVMNISLFPIPLIGAIAAFLCALGQVGDFAASTIKRYFKVKDFSNLIPGHGGMIDRIDSVIFMAPFAYFLFMVLF